MGKSKGTRKVVFCVAGNHVVMHTKVNSADGRKRYGDKIEVALTDDVINGMAVGKGAYVNVTDMEQRIADAVKVALEVL